jgi:hypothetical protein
MHSLICCPLTKTGPTRGAAKNEKASAFVLRLVAATHNLSARSVGRSFLTGPIFEKPRLPLSVVESAMSNELRHRAAECVGFRWNLGVHAFADSYSERALSSGGSASHCFEKIETEPKTTKSLLDCHALDTNGDRRSLTLGGDSSSSLMSRARTCGLLSCFGHGNG